MSFLNMSLDAAAEHLYDLFKSSWSSDQQAMNVPYAPLANTPERMPYGEAPMQVATPGGLLQQMQATGVSGNQVLNSPMQTTPEQYAEAVPSADETIKGALETLKADNHEESNTATNRRLAMLGLGLKAAGELMDQHMRSGFSVQSAGTGRGYVSPDAYLRAQAERRAALLGMGSDLSKFSGRGLLR